MANIFRTYQIGPAKDSWVAIFRNLGSSYTFHTMKLSDLPDVDLQATTNCVCKIPPGFIATAEIWQVNLATHKDFLFTFKLGPSTVAGKAMGSAEVMKYGVENQNGIGEVTTCEHPDCGELQINCGFDEKPVCNSTTNVLSCERGEG